MASHGPEYPTLMSSARSNVVRCGAWGTIEFVHTRKVPDALCDELHYDRQCGLWRATPALAMRDMRSARRSLGLIEEAALDEPV